MTGTQAGAASGLAWRPDAALAVAALALMAVLPAVEMALRPLLGGGVQNAPALVQHLGLVLAMAGSLVAARSGHLATFAGGLGHAAADGRPAWHQQLVRLCAAVLCGALAWASAELVASEIPAGRPLAYGLPVWVVQSAMPIGFALLGWRLGASIHSGAVWRHLAGAGATGAGAWLAHALGALPAGLPLAPAFVGLAVLLLAGAPIFAVIGGLALVLFWHAGQPIAAIALSHYSITVNPSLPALPLFTLAGLIFARTGAARRLSAVFVSCFGAGTHGTLIGTALLCSCFTAFTGGSGVTILALGGLLLPLLLRAGLPQARAIGLVTSASALGVLLAPSVPLIMYAILARVPIGTMFLAGIVPALVMVAFLLVVGGYLRRSPATMAAPAQALPAQQALWDARWELAAPVMAIGSLAGGLATPTESAALTVLYAAATQALIHREIDWRGLRDTAVESAQVIGGVMLILGMALGLTNYLVDAGIPDAAVEWVQQHIPNRWVFLLALNVFLFAAGALMEIFAALAVLVPLLLPMAQSYGIDPVHFGIIFLANLEMGFLCPPAGMNVYFAAAMFRRPLREVAVAVLPSVAALFLGTLAISAWPLLATGLPRWILGWGG